MPWYILFAYELPVWLWWVAISPIAFAISRRFPLRGSLWPRNFVIHLLAAAALAPCMVTTVNFLRLMMQGVLAAAGQVRDPRLVEYLDIGAFFPGVWATLGRFFSFTILVYFAVIAVHHIVQAQNDLARKSLRESELEASLSKTQLDLLRAQIQPHFLFNTLNTISGLMTRDIALARDVLTNLGDLLRASLNVSDEHETTLADELRGLDSYLAIVSARFGEHLRIDRRIATDVTRALVPRMLLQPLVENAIQHGMTESDDPLCIEIMACRRNSSLYISVRDDGQGLGGNETITERIGIGNTRRRLERLYPGRSTFSARSPDDGGFKVTITLPLRLRGPVINHDDYV